jgi:hypothetical protein
MKYFMRTLIRSRFFLAPLWSFKTAMAPLRLVPITAPLLILQKNPRILQIHAVARKPGLPQTVTRITNKTDNLRK